MRLLPSDPDIETIVGRIATGDIKLQPGFQRGEVWSRAKKQRLIDSILRDWHVPPIHVIENPHTRKQEVLDGQQRLVAIRDFVDECFPVDGSIEPHDAEIASLNGISYKKLPPEWRRRFNQFTIRVFRIVDFLPSEPGELFFRLNQPTNLTGAEQRNAFFGPVREQIKTLVEQVSALGIGKDVLGFSNFRMAYDDVFSRLVLAIERGSISEKITAADLTSLYRRDEGLGPRTSDCAHEAILRFAAAKQTAMQAPKLNKATLFSWLIFLARMILGGHRISDEALSRYLEFFQKARDVAVHSPARKAESQVGPIQDWTLFAVYESRSTARVADISSVILRDAIIWLVFEQFAYVTNEPKLLDSHLLEPLHAAVGPAGFQRHEDDSIARRLVESGWGMLS